MANKLGTTKTEKKSIKTSIERCLPLYYKHLESKGASNKAYNIDEFLDWFNQRDDISEMRRSRGGWKSDRSSKLKSHRSTERN